MIWVVGCLGKEWWWTSVVSGGSQLRQGRLGAGRLLVHQEIGDEMIFLDIYYKHTSE